MKYAVLLLAGLMVLGGAGIAEAGHSVLCLNVTAALGVFLSFISNGTPDDTDLLAVPGSVSDALICH